MREAMVKCPICGAPMEGEVCGYCGYREKRALQPAPGGRDGGSPPQQQMPRFQAPPPQAGVQASVPVNGGIVPGVSRSSRTTALLLCIFLGGAGAHRFYVGKVGTGILYLCTLGLCGIGWFVDLILLSMGVFRDEFDLPLKD